MGVMRIHAWVITWAIGLVPVASASSQNQDDLARLVALYRSGNVEQAATGLQALVRAAETREQRALLEFHLGLALLRVRPAESTAALRRSIALDPDFRPEVSGATPAERGAWDAVRAQMRIPNGIRFDPASYIAGSGDSLGITVDLPLPTGVPRPRARVLLAVSPGRDPLELWSGIAGDRGMWDGRFGGESPVSGTYPLIVEVLDEAGAAPLRWRRALAVNAQAVTEPLRLAPRPARLPAMIPIRVSDTEGRRRARRRGAVWVVGGGIVSFAASRMVPDVIRLGAPNSGPRVALASVYGAGLASTVYGGLKVLRSVTRRYETTVMVPDEGVLRRQCAADAAWEADSARISSFNARLGTLSRISIQVKDRP